MGYVFIESEVFSWPLFVPDFFSVRYCIVCPSLTCGFWLPFSFLLYLFILFILKGCGSNSAAWFCFIVCLYFYVWVYMCSSRSSFILLQLNTTHLFTPFVFLACTSCKKLVHNWSLHFFQLYTCDVLVFSLFLYGRFYVHRRFIWFKTMDRIRHTLFISFFQTKPEMLTL